MDRSTAESSRAALERKAKIYEKLKKGKSGGLSEAQYDALLVDVCPPIFVVQLHSIYTVLSVQFDSKPGNSDDFSSDSEDVDESLSVPRPVDDDVSSIHVLSFDLLSYDVLGRPVRRV